MSKFKFLLAFIILLGVQSSFSRISAQSRQSKQKVDLAKAFANIKDKIQYSKEFKMDGKTYAIVYTRFSSLHTDNVNAVHNVYIVPEGYDARSISKTAEPPQVSKAILHTDGPDDDTGSLGVVLAESKYGADGTYKGCTTKEIMLPEDIGEELFYLLIGKRKWSKPLFNLESKYSMDLEPERFTPAKKWSFGKNK